ncbi:MAG: elongation factor G [Candidatus Muirbacterium halophilum]|nr:elongation factor G [Candidatus Muirbacterium halophilum]
MKLYDSDKIRNVVLLGPSGAGKTSIAEAFLFNSGANNRLGSVDSGTSVCDFLEEEHEKKMSISGKLAVNEWNECKINLLDTPGSPDFQGEAIRMSYVADGFVLVLDASSGVDAQAIKSYEYVEGKAGLVFINKMEVERANFNNVLSQVKERISSTAIPIVIPMGLEKDFVGVIDLINEKAITADETGKNLTISEIPEEYADEVAKYKEQLIESIVETDESMMEKYLEGEDISNELLINAFVNASKKGQLMGVLCGNASKNIGVLKLMDFVTNYLPAPTEIENIVAIDEETNEEIEFKIETDKDFTAFVFKTMSETQSGESAYFKVMSGKFKAGEIRNVTKNSFERINNIFSLRGKDKVDCSELIAGDIGVTVKLKSTGTNDTLSSSKNFVEHKKIKFPEALIAIAIVPKTQADQDKLGTALNKLRDEDPTMRVVFNPEFLQTIVSGMGEQHLNVVINRLKKRNGLEVEVEKPRIAYRETIRNSVKTEKKYKKQSGGKGQYGHCLLEMHPLERGVGFEFVDKIFGGSIPGKYVPSIEKGCRESMEKGTLAGYPVIDIKVVVYDGSFHLVDSSDMAFKLAGSMAFKDGMDKASPVILEPIMEVEVVIPDEFMGDIMGDMNGRRGRIMGTEAYKKGFTKVKSTVPESEMYKYINDLRSMTQGQGTFTMKLDHYEECPSNVQEKVVAETKKLEEESDK